MSENTQPTSSDQPKSSRWLLWPVIAAIVVLTLFSLTQPAPGSYGSLTRSDEGAGSVDARIAKVGALNLAGQAAATQTASAEAAAAPAEAAAPAPAAAATGEVPALYKKSCAMCHGTGAGGAPKVGDKDAWAPRIATGMDELMKVAINGRGGMPARGGTKASDDELKTVVEYMVAHSQ
ncbi:cytochrome c5 family protein [Ottowia cancrivicina]|uniref:C-type cytochrome n=1 Tax=Ottowia cancrivicina TaxID=3040346 RepID=A0AAW6RNV6_9BURK|nr:c-type cytochrome [Ottowia sp. 10c7w1]MDG9699190.1 c-type cytochrome [Ottowia sp. 10c7w1]